MPMEREKNSLNSQTKDRYLDLSEPALLNDNHYHTETEVSLVSLRTEDKPSKGGRLWPPTVSNVSPWTWQWDAVDWMDTTFNIDSVERGCKRGHPRR
jgi:hypothetical protein